MTDIERAARVCDAKAARYRELAKNYADRSDRDGTPTADIAGYLMNLRERTGAAEMCAAAIRALPASTVEGAREEFTKACAEWHTALDGPRLDFDDGKAVAQRNAIVARRNEAWRKWQAAEAAERGASS